MKKMTALLAALMMLLGILFNGALASEGFVQFEPYDGRDIFKGPSFPDLSDELIPINLSREDQGIRF